MSPPLAAMLASASPEDCREAITYLRRKLLADPLQDLARECADKGVKAVARRTGLSKATLWARFHRAGIRLKEMRS